MCLVVALTSYSSLTKFCSESVRHFIYHPFDCIRIFLSLHDGGTNGIIAHF
jgi:hypothetical protein